MRSSSATRVSIIVLPTNFIRLVGDALRAQVVLGLGGVQEEQVGEVIDDDPVDLLGHRTVEAAQPGLDVADCDPEPIGTKARGQGGVDVAGNEHEVRALGAQHGFQALEASVAVCSP